MIVGGSLWPMSVWGFWLLTDHKVSKYYVVISTVGITIHITISITISIYVLKLNRYLKTGLAPLKLIKSSLISLTHFQWILFEHVQSNPSIG